MSAAPVGCAKPPRVRDMSRLQFELACKRNGLEPEGFWGYYKVGHGVSVSVFNAGLSWRERLAYLLREKSKAEKEAAAKGGAV